MKLFLRAALVALVCALAFASAASARSIVFAGIDAEDGGPGAHGPIANYCQLVNSMLADSTNGGDNVLVFGAGKVAGDGPTTFWEAIDTCISDSVTMVNGAANTSSQSLAGFAMIAVVSSAQETSNGLTQAEQDALLARSSAITTFVNDGGSLLGFSQTGLSNPYQYVGGVGALSVNTFLSYSDIEPTPQGTARGITDALDLCCWHDSFSTVPSGFDVLAFVESQPEAAVIGTASTVSIENCTNGVDDDGDGAIDGADSDCAVVVPENCTNGVDDDGDGAIDGADSDCAAPTEDCTNGVDDDGDGLVDANDPDCGPPPTGTGSTCYGLAVTPTTTNTAGEIVGTSGDDVINGTAGGDVIRGLGGNDVICGRGGDDLIYGGTGNDLLDGDEGDDTIYGGTGDDRVLGDDGDDRLVGQDGNDRVNGEADSDSVDGSDGDDQVLGGDGDDDVFGSGGVDDVRGQNGDDEVNGGTGDDGLRGGEGSDMLRGGPDTDNCDGGPGVDPAPSACETTSNYP